MSIAINRGESGVWTVAVVVSIGIIVGFTPAVTAVDFSLDEFEQLHRMIRPQPGESKWTGLSWLTNLTDARKQAAAQGKPMLVWMAGGGDPLGFV